jgi:hypothetical protein
MIDVRVCEPLFLPVFPFRRSTASGRRLTTAEAPDQNGVEDPPRDDAHGRVTLLDLTRALLRRSERDLLFARATFGATPAAGAQIVSA